MNISELINELNEIDEHPRLEAKTGSAVGDAVLRSVCAFSNEPDLGGGHILFGLVNDESSENTSYHIDGVDDPDQLTSDLISQCASRFNRRIRPRTETETVNGEPVVVAEIQELNPSEKPVFFESIGLPEGAYRRAGSSDVQCTEDDMVTLFGDRQADTFDRSIVDDASMEDLSEQVVSTYRDALKEANPDAEALQWDQQELLQALNCVRRDDDGNPRPTVAGVLMFGSKKALRRLFPMVRVDYIRVPGTEWVEDPDERYETTLDLREALLDLIPNASSAVIEDLPQGFSFGDSDLRRENEPIIPPRALREALVNALMHRDYRVQKPVQIIRYQNRLEIKNPGYSLVSEDRLGEPGSEHRNPIIAEILHETGYAETKGTGINAMRDYMKQANLAPPTFESDREGNKFTARFLMHHFLTEDDVQWVYDVLGREPSSDEANALVFVREMGAIDNSTYRQLNDVTTLDASRALRELRDIGLLEQKESGRATYYVPSDRLTDSLQDVDRPSGSSTTLDRTKQKELDMDPGLSNREASLSGEEESLSDEEDGLSNKSESLSNKENGLSHKEEDVSNKEKRLSNKEDVEHQSSRNKTRDDLLSELPDRVVEQIRNIGQRSKPDVMENAIIDICRVRAFKKEEIAKILDRTPHYVMNQYISDLLEEDRLKRTIPEMKNHPDQAYKTKEDTEDNP